MKEDTIEQRELRKQLLLESERHDIASFTEEEIKRALQEMNNKKVPEYNGRALRLKH